MALCDGYLDSRIQMVKWFSSWKPSIYMTSKCSIEQDQLMVMQMHCQEDHAMNAIIVIDWRGRKLGKMTTASTALNTNCTTCHCQLERNLDVGLNHGLLKNSERRKIRIQWCIKFFSGWRPDTNLPGEMWRLKALKFASTGQSLNVSSSLMEYYTALVQTRRGRDLLLHWASGTKFFISFINIG